MVAPLAFSSPRVGGLSPQAHVCDMCQARQATVQAASKNLCGVCKDKLLQEALQKKQQEQSGPMCDLCQALPATSKLLSKSLCANCHVTVMNKAKEKGLV